MGVDVVQMIDLADVIFSDDKGTPEERGLTMHELFDWIIHLRGSKQATVKDLTIMQQMIKKDMDRSLRIAASRQMNTFGNSQPLR